MARIITQIVFMAPFRCACDRCGWFGRDSALIHRHRPGCDARSFYGPEPDDDWCECPECGFEVCGDATVGFHLTGRRKATMSNLLH